ncbi:hypothetical protein ACJJIF_00795 [Microbulbifer sp. SSSA002]|uniref:hypothetical protein n=1 Tax=Microbulbifer sp. SSSA002 TaxID=3243376 RepID=UPI004039AD86
MNSLTEEQAFEAFLRTESAIKDILYMYYTCVDYSGLFDDFGTEWEEFDPLEYIDFNHDSLGGYSLDIKLLNEGSAIKLACKILQTWGQGNIHSDYMQSVRDLVKSERIDHMPELKTFIKLALHSYPEGNEKSVDIYQKYIVGYFHELTKNAKFTT